METTRRKFLITASLAGAALMLRCRKGDSPPAARAEAFRASTWIKLHPDGRVEFLVPKMEMGQGVATALAVIVADELCVDLGVIDARFPASDEVGNAVRVLGTGGTKSVRTMWPMLRAAAATGREMLVGAAAERWKVSPEECHVESGVVVHAASGRRTPYGELLADARRRPKPKNPRRLAPDRRRLIGRPHRRIEGPEIVAGRALYGCDVRLPGLRYAVLARPPVAGAKLLAFDSKAALAEPGVLAVLPIGDAVAVVGETSWDAMRGRRALGAKWSSPEAESFSTQTFEASLLAALDAPPTDRYDPKAREMGAVEVVRRGEPMGSPRAGAPVLSAEYATAFQAHAPMETLNATVWIRDEVCEIWTGTQAPGNILEKVRRQKQGKGRRLVVHAHRMGGGFGRKEEVDWVQEAVAVADAAGGGPVQLLWTRDDDLTHDSFHPATMHRLSAELGAKGVRLWRHRVAAPSAEKQWAFGSSRRFVVIPKGEAKGAWDLPYDFPNLLVDYVDPPVPIRLGFWRGIEISSNVFAVESFVDELAHAARRDPIEFRIAQLADSVPSQGVDTRFALTRFRATLELARDKSDWGRRLPAGSGRGIAGCVFDGHSAAVSVAEVTVRDGELRVDRIVCAVDCGLVVNPLGLEGTIESSVAWALSALSSEITFDKGRAQQSTLVSYAPLRFNRMPKVDVHAVPSDEDPSGAGEIPVPTIAPAIANAIFAATGRRLRRLPLRPGDLK